MKRFAMTLLGALVLLVLVCPGVAAAGSISWSGIAPNWSPLSNPFTVTSSDGITATGSMPTGNVLVTHECLIPTSVTPCADVRYFPGDWLLFTNNTTGPLTFSFSAGLQSIDTQVQTNWYGSFTATLTAYGAGNVLVGSTTISGSTASTHDGTADLLGFTTSGTPIYSIAITATSSGPLGSDAFFINQLNLTPEAVPEPSTWLLLGTGLAGLAVRRRFTKRT